MTTKQLPRPDIAAGQLSDVMDDGKDPAAVMLGRRGGLKGGKARALAMTPEQRSDAARKAATARWRLRDLTTGKKSG